MITRARTNGPAYAVFDRNEEAVAFADTEDEAMHIAQRLGPNVYFDAPEVEVQRKRMAANNGEVIQFGAANIRRAPAEALRAVQAAMKNQATPLVTMEQVSAMSAEEAWTRLRPMFPVQKVTKSGKASAIKAYATPDDMADNVLGQNYKTAKGTPADIRSLVRRASKERYGRSFSDANVKGLSILPHTTSYTDENVAQIRDTMMQQLYGVQDVRKVRLQACSKATPECAASCLVFSGRNLADDYNSVKKYSLLQSLVHEPIAFCRMLVDAVQMHHDRSMKTGVMPLVRLNVFSDLPWELIFPDLFAHFDGENFVQFYDYTKVPARRPPPNYDITFSFAGQERNVDDMEFEINQNRRRIAVVFARISQRRIPGQGLVQIPAKPPAGAKGLPAKLWGLDVVDGDVSDMRPFDPEPCIVALRWKTPANQGVTLVDADAFIVKGTMVDGHFICAETPIRTLDYSASEAAVAI